ncbi:MAG: hypothetical protein A2Z57_11130 [Planctomycetes bacterium RIFCSPHIGHO2_12_39_6]|nr:MAG: hypothetical protein A2Z57_11130 [Planctomycetes bacterium RIFCSPHIGHO2_12_39_6]
MAFDVSGISTWNDERSDKNLLLQTALLTPKSMKYFRKIGGISGENVKLPVFETTTPWQAGTGCNYTTSGTTTITQKTITTVPVTVQETICPNTLQDLFTKQTWIPGNTSTPETGEVISWWVERKLAQLGIQLERALWQAKTTYTNATYLKHFDGFIEKIDAASDEVVVTARTSITTSNVLDIFDEFCFNATTGIPNQIADKDPKIFCGYDTFRILQNKLWTGNYFNVKAEGSSLDAFELMYPGTNIKVIGVPGLNNNSPVDSGSLATAVKNRIFATYTDNLVVGFNVEADTSNFEVWYSKDDRNIKCHMRFFVGVLPVFTDEIAAYANT